MESTLLLKQVAAVLKRHVRVGNRLVVGLSGGLVFAVGLVLIRERGGCRVGRRLSSRIPNLRELGAIPSAKRDPALQTGRYRLSARTRIDCAVEQVTRDLAQELIQRGLLRT